MQDKKRPRWEWEENQRGQVAQRGVQREEKNACMVYLYRGGTRYTTPLMLRRKGFDHEPRDEMPYRRAV
jgi:hypothetical protein